MLIAPLVLAAAAATAPTAQAADPAYVEHIHKVRQGRVASLTKADGWLSLTGLPWLERGRNSVGSAADNDVVLPEGPAHLGTITWHDNGKVTIHLAEDVAAEINGQQQRSAELLDDSHDQRTTVAYGNSSFYLISRGPKKGLRIKNPKAPTRAHFRGIDYFPIDESWRIEARYIPFEHMHEMKVGTVIGTVATYPVPGKLVFQRGGETYTLLPVIEVPGAEDLFILMADRTSGKTTYGGGRAFYIDWPDNGKAVIDFNKAHNPPCAFTPYATCSLPPQSNRLDLKVTVGEKLYAHDPAAGNP